MAIEIVGLGKLPNVYFEKITLEDHDEKSFKVLTHLIVLDEIEESNFIWSSDPLISGFMKIALIETSNTLMISELSDGRNVHPAMLKTSPNWNTDSKLHIYGYGDLNKSEDVDDKHFKLKTPIVKPKDASELALFVYAYIDHKELSKYLEVKLTGALSNYMGPVASEIVMSGGNIPKTSNIFRKSNSTVCYGPVHQIGSEWYSGPAPSDDSLKLTRETVKNSKIIDFRSRSLRDRSSMTFRTLPIISEAHYSLNSDADLFGVFSVDMRNLVLSKTKLGKAIYGLSESLLTRVVGSITLNSVEIYRRQVKFRRQTNRLGSPLFSKEDVLPREMIASMADLKELNITQDKFIKTYTFSDHGKTEGSRGEYIYEAKMSFVDKTQDLVEGFVSTIKTNLNGLKDVVRRLNAPRNYDYSTESLTTTVPSVVDLYIKDYYMFFGMIKDVDDVDLSEMVSAKQTSFNTGNYRSSYGVKFINEYEKLYNIIHNRFGVSPRELGQSKFMPSNSYPPNIVDISKTFEEPVKFDDVESSYDVLGKTDNKEILILEREEMEARADMEISRFFDTSKSVSSEDTFGIDDNDSEALRDLGASKMLFLAPLAFQFQGDKSSTEKMSDINLDKISLKFVQAKARKVENRISTRTSATVGNKSRKVNDSLGRKPKRSTLKKSRFKFNFRPVVLKINQISKNRGDHIESSEYLGNSSEFVNVEPKTDRSIPAADSLQTELRFSIANEVSIRRSKKQFDLTEKGSFYEKLKSSKYNAPDKLRKLPLATKALFNSRSRAANNNILEAESDILKSVDTKVASEMVFHSNQKIEVLGSYEKSTNGESILSKPIWIELTSKILDERTELLCKMSYVEDASVGITPAKEFKMPVLNSTFIIKGSSISLPSPQAIPDSMENLSEVPEVAYTTSNIIKQPRS